MNIGISTFLFFYYRLSEREIKFIADAGFKNIEIWGMKPHFNCEDKNYITNILSLIKQYKLKVDSFHAPFFFNINENGQKDYLSISAKDENFRKRSVAEVIKLINIMPEFSSKILVLHSGFGVHGNFELSKESFLKSLKEITQRTQENKISVAVENEPYKDLPNDNVSMRSISSFISSYNKDLCGICIDVGHSFVNKELENDLVDSKILTAHISDNDGLKDQHLVPYSGAINWDLVAGSLLNIPMKLEVADKTKGKFNSDEWVKMLDNLKKIKEQLIGAAKNYKPS